MRLKGPALATALSVLCFGLSVNSLADTRLSIQHTDAGKPSQMQAVLITSGKVRMEQGADDDTLLLYFQANNTFYAVQPSDKSYMEFDPEKAAEMVDQASQMRQQMMDQLQERMKELPEEQRAQMMEMMERSGQTMPGVEEEPVRYESRGSDSVGGFSCRWVDAYHGTKKVRDLCLADPGSMGVAAADKETMMAMQTSMMALAKRMGNAGMFQDNMPDGFPVHVRHFDASGQVSSEQRVQSVSTDTLDASLFELPAGYQKRELPSFPQH